MSAKLKACGCGTAPIVDRFLNDEGFYSFAIYCPTCADCGIEGLLIIKHSRAEATAAWNCRAEVKP